jgi:branched-chain amino acid transport system ATP-binding protein
MSERLECSNLTGGRGTSIAFRDVDLAVAAGTIEALLGPNGAGKTTLLLSVAGMLRQMEGTVAVDGVVLKPGRPVQANRAGIVLVPDNRNLFTSLTVEENLKAAARRHGPTPRDLIDFFPMLEKRWTLRAGALSGGEQQMLAMARALILQPKVLLIDEMSMGLAPLVVASLFETVRRIASEQGCAVVLVEQHVNLALEIADSAVVLNRGSVVLREDSEALRAAPERLEVAYFGADAAVPRDAGSKQ